MVCAVAELVASSGSAIRTSTNRLRVVRSSGGTPGGQMKVQAAHRALGARRAEEYAQRLQHRGFARRVRANDRG
jgi:hypothetical protein